MARISIALVTWPNHPRRIEYFRRGIVDLKRRLCVTDPYALEYVCSAETERDPAQSWHGAEVESLCHAHGVRLQWRHGPANLGANMNAALQMCTGELLLLVQDDWHLEARLDLRDGASFLLSNPRVALLRYSWPAGKCTLRDHPDGWRRIDINGLWPYGDDPHLRRPDFMERYGWYLEGGHHGTASATLMRDLCTARAEIAVAEQVYFRHIGEVSAVLNDSRQRRTSR